MSSRLQMKIKNQKVILDISQDKQQLTWTLENRFDERRYTNSFTFHPKETDRLINLTSQKKFQIKIKYETCEIVRLEVVKFMVFTLYLANPMQENARFEDQEEQETLNAFTIEDQDDVSTNKGSNKGKVLHQQYDDLNPSNYSNFSNIYPYSSQVCIRITYNVKGVNRICFGSGCLISPSIVLTCAHNVFSCTRRVFYTSMEVKSYGRPAIQVSSCRIPQEFIERVMNNSNDESEYDYAILVLKEYSLMKPLSLLFNFQEKVIAQIPGHPATKKKEKAPAKGKNKVPIDKNIGNVPDYNINTYRLKNARNLLQKYKENLIPHKISTAPGQSGSPILVQLQKSIYYIIGIHVADDQQNEQNLAVRLSPRILKQILNWCSQVPVPISKYNFIKTVMPTVVDYKSLAPVAPEDFGFSLRDVEKHLTAFKQKGQIREQKGDFRKAGKYYAKVKQFKQEYKNESIQKKIVEMNIKYANVYRLYQQEYKERLAREWQRTKIKVPKDKQLAYYQKAKEALRECQLQASLVLWYVEYFQSFCEVMKRMIQFQEEGNKYGKHKVFEGLAKKLEEEEDQSIKKYAKNHEEQFQVISLYNNLRAECLLKLGQSYSDENKRKFKMAYKVFKDAEACLQRVKQANPSLLIEIQHKIFNICTYQTKKLFGQTQEGVLITAVEYASKIIDNFRRIDNKQNKIAQHIVGQIQKGLFLIMKEQFQKEDRRKIQGYIDTIVQNPRVIMKRSGKEQIMSFFKFV